MPTFPTDLEHTALLVVDAQPTFMPGGELPVPAGDKIIAPLLDFLRVYGHELGLIVFSRDWHPRDHNSFSPQPLFEDGSWPVHGVAGSKNAEVHPALLACCSELGLPYIVISKGMDKDKEAYSAFDGFNLNSAYDGFETALDAELFEHSIDNLIVAGLAGEVCVQATALAGVNYGYNVTLFQEATAFLGNPKSSLTIMTVAGVLLS
jgi:nicotinamidase/pyrazinamidase